MIVFESRARLTAYDNAGHTEIYRYSNKDKSMRCVSCNPMEAPATSNARLGDYNTLRRTTVIHNVSDSGNHVFFETPEALVAADTDGINDIYEWQQPGGVGAPVLSLISSGKSIVYPQEPLITPPRPNMLLGITPDGSDVFFVSQDALVAGASEGGATAIYDARIEGGFAGPPLPAIACSEETPCQGEPAPPPALASAASQAVTGAGNVRPRKRHRCSHRRSRSNQKHRSCHRKKSRSKR